MKFALIIAAIFLLSSIEYTFGGISEDFFNLFCELPIEGKDQYFNCKAEGFPEQKDRMQSFEDCFGQPMSHGSHLICCNPNDDDEEKAELCFDKVPIDRTFEEEELDDLFDLMFQCLMQAVDVHEQDMVLPINGSRQYSNCP